MSVDTVLGRARGAAVVPLAIHDAGPAGRLPIAVGESAGELEMVDGARLTDDGVEYQVRTKEDRIYHFPKALARVSRRGGLAIASSIVTTW